MKRLFVLLISVFVLLCGTAHAAEKMRLHEIYSLAYYEADVDRYDASKTDLDGTIVWTIDGLFSGDPDRVKYASLETGQVDSRKLNNGYIIQKDPGEYTGVLYAVEKEGAVEIWHMKYQGDHELVAEYDIALPYYEQGYQTVRAYMHGNLYYIKALEDTLFRTRRSPDNGDLDLMEEISYPAPRKAELCRIDQQGEEYLYSLNNYDINEWRISQSIIDGYALSPDGKLAYAIGQYEFDPDTAYRIMVENPGESVRLVLTEDMIKSLGFDHIHKLPLCWLDNNTLIFVVYSPRKGGIDNLLYKIDVNSGKAEPVLNEQGEIVHMRHKIVNGSSFYLSSDKSLIAYMGRPNLQSDGRTEFPEAVPNLIDLKTGENYILYQNEADDSRGALIEKRDNTGQLSWME